MAKKMMTAQEATAVDWAALFAKFPAFAAILAQLLQLFLAAPAPAKAAQAAKCCDELKEACDAECDALCTLVVAHCELHDQICCEPCPPETK